MSKMGRYVETQIEKGNFTVDENTGVYRVGFENREKRAITPSIAEHPVQQDGAGRQCADEDRQAE